MSIVKWSGRSRRDDGFWGRFHKIFQDMAFHIAEDLKEVQSLVGKHWWWPRYMWAKIHVQNQTNSEKFQNIILKQTNLEKLYLSAGAKKNYSSRSKQLDKNI